MCPSYLGPLHSATYITEGRWAIWQNHRKTHSDLTLCTMLSVLHALRHNYVRKDRIYMKEANGCFNLFFTGPQWIPCVNKHCNLGTVAPSWGGPLKRSHDLAENTRSAHNGNVNSIPAILLCCSRPYQWNLLEQHVKARVIHTCLVTCLPYSYIRGGGKTAYIIFISNRKHGS